MRRLLLALVLAASAACATVPASIQNNPAAVTAFKADQVVQRISELQNAAIQANATGGLDTVTTRAIVTFTVDAAKTAKATPAGWTATLVTAWDAFKASVPIPANNVALQTALAAVDAILGEYR